MHAKEIELQLDPNEQPHEALVRLGIIEAGFDYHYGEYKRGEPTVKMLITAQDDIDLTDIPKTVGEFNAHMNKIRANPKFIRENALLKIPRKVITKDEAVLESRNRNVRASYGNLIKNKFDVIEKE